MILIRENDGMLKITDVHPSEAHIIVNAHDMLSAINYHLKHNNEASFSALQQIADRTNQYVKKMGQPA